MEGEERNYEKKKTWITEGLIIGLITIVSYVITYIYNRYYLLYFGIPSDFVYLDLKSTITTMMFTGMLLLGNIFVLLSLIDWLPSIKLWQLLFCSYFFFIGFSTSLFYNLYFIFFIIAYIILVLISIVKMHKPNNKVNFRVYLNLPNLPKKFILIYIVLSIAVLCFFVSSLGYYSALKNNIFLISSTNQEMLVITKYENYLICIPFNRETKEANKRFVIIDPSTNPDINYHLENIGPIKMID